MSGATLSKTLEKSSPKKLQVDNVEMKGVDQDKTLDMLLVVKLSEHATIPTRGSPLAAGYDLYSAQDTNIPARGKGLVKTDIQIRVPRGTYGRVAPRSGLAWKQHIRRVEREEREAAVGRKPALRTHPRAAPR